MTHNADVAYQQGYEIINVDGLDIHIGDTTTYYTADSASHFAYTWSLDGESVYAHIDASTGLLTVDSIPTGGFEVLTVRLTATCGVGQPDGATLVATKTITLIDPSLKGVKPTGCYGDTVVLNDLVPHAWSRYTDSTLPRLLYSPEPYDVHIRYVGNGYMYKDGTDTDTAACGGAAVSRTEPEHTFLYYRTLERDTVRGCYPYRLIPNPYSKRPRCESDEGHEWRGFAGWRVASAPANGDIKRHAGSTLVAVSEGDVLTAGDSIYFFPTNTADSCMSLGLEAVWARAAVVECADVTAINAALTNSTLLPYDSHELNFIVITGSGALNGDIGNLNARSATISMNRPDGTRAAGADARLAGSVKVMNGTLKIEHLNMAGDDDSYIGGVWAGISPGDGRDVVVIVGRGVTPYGDSRVCVGSVSGFRNNREDSPYFNLTNHHPKYRIRVESGVYYHMYGGCYPYAEHLIGTVDATFGNDFDRAQNVNHTLQAIYSAGINFSTQFGWNGDDTEINNPRLSHICILCGTFVGTASHKDAEKGGVFTLSIPNWSRKMDVYTGKRRLDIYGGVLSGISGGGEIRTYRHPDVVMVDVCMHGGTVLGCIYGGMQAESSTTTNLVGSRRFVVTGGTVGGWIAGAANATNNKSQDNQVLKGYTYLYLGGNAVVGDGSDNQYSNAPSGNVYGAGIGNSENALGGGCMASNVVVADNATINGSIFGGGNYGFIKADQNTWPDGSTSPVAHYTDIHLLGGAVQGSVYGTNAHRAGSGYPVRIYIGHDTTGTAVVKGNIYCGGQDARFTTGGHDFFVQMCSGTVEGNIYGGGEGSSATVDGTTDVRMLGGTVRGSVFGGGQSGNVNGGTSVVVGDVDGTLYGGGAAIGGDIYGGGESGHVSNGYATTRLRRVGSFDGAANAVYGGGREGNVADTRLVMYPTWNTGLDRLYGGGYAGDVSGTANTYVGYTLEDGSAPDSAGHSMDDQAAGYTVRTLFGGNDYGGTTARSVLRVNGGHYQNIYGGGDGRQARADSAALPNSPRPTTDIYHCVADGDVFGGGCFGTSTAAQYGNVGLTLNVHGGRFGGSLFGGARGAVGDTSLHLVVGAKTVNMGGGYVAGSVYGGSCSSNDGEGYSGAMHASSTVNISGGTVMENVYGGCYAGMVYGSTYVSIGLHADAGGSMPAWMQRGDLLLNNSVYGGSNWGVSQGEMVFDTPGIDNGNTYIVVDGKDYRTYVEGQTHVDESGWDTAGAPTMRLRYSIVGSGTSCESGEAERTITLRNYGSSACDGAQELWSIQRATSVLLQNTAVRYLGQTDALYAYPTVNYSLNRIGTLIARGYNVLQLEAPTHEIGATRFLNAAGNTPTTLALNVEPDCGADDCSDLGLWGIINRQNPFTFILGLGGIDISLGSVSGKAFLMTEEGYMANVTATTTDGGAFLSPKASCATDDCEWVRAITTDGTTRFSTGCGRRKAEVTVVAYNTPDIYSNNTKISGSDIAIAWDTLRMPPVLHAGGLYRMVAGSAVLVPVGASFSLLDGALRRSNIGGGVADWEGGDVSAGLHASPTDRFGLLLATATGGGISGDSQHLMHATTGAFDLSALADAADPRLLVCLTYDTTLGEPMLADYRFTLVELASADDTEGDSIDITVHIVTATAGIEGMAHELHATSDGTTVGHDTRYRIINGGRAGMMVDLAGVEWQPYDAATMGWYAEAMGYNAVADGFGLTGGGVALDSTVFIMDLRPTEQMGEGISVTNGWLNPVRDDVDLYALAAGWGAALPDPAPVASATGDAYLGAFDGRTSSAVRFRLGYTGLASYADSTLVGRAVVRFRAMRQTGYNTYDTEHPIYFADTLYVVTFAAPPVVDKDYWIRVVTSERLAHVCFDSAYTYAGRPHLDTGLVVEYNGDVHIYNEEGLAWFISMVNGLNGAQARTMFFNKVYLHRKANGTDYDMSAHYWTPVGRTQHPFMGRFLGSEPNSNRRAEVVVSGLEVPDSLLDYSGLFGITDSARISHITLRGATLRGTDHVGGIAGHATRTRFDTCRVVDASSLGGSYAVGGIVGSATGCRVNGCRVQARFRVDAVYVGGIVGFGSGDATVGGNNTIINNESVLDADTCISIYFGGIAGWLDDIASPLSAAPALPTAPKSLVADGTVVANNAVRLRAGNGNLRVGGLVGYAGGARLENNYVAGTLDGGVLTGVAAAVGGEAVDIDCLFYNSANNYSAVAMPTGTVSSSNLAGFNGTGSEVTLDTAVHGVTNLTQALNIWVGTHDDDDYLGWRSDVRGTASGLPVFGRAEAVATYHRTDLEQCDSLAFGDSVYTRSTNLYLHHVDSTLYSDSVVAVWLTVHRSTDTVYTDTLDALALADSGQYEAHGFVVGPERLALLADEGVLVLTDSLASQFGCDSIVTLRLVCAGGARAAVADAVSVSVAPNPTTGTVSVGCGPGAKAWRLMDATGRTVGHGTAAGPLRLDLSGLPAGPYYLRIATDRWTRTAKLIKE